MNVFLGNLSIEEIEKRSGVKFPEDLISFMEPRRQENASNIKPGKWHCFDVPFSLVCGDMQTAVEIHKHLSPMSKEFKESLEIALSS